MLGVEKLRILDLCNGYLLIMVIIQGVVLITADYGMFKYYKMDEVAKKCRVLGISVMTLFICLFFLKLFLTK